MRRLRSIVLLLLANATLVTAQVTGEPGTPPPRTPPPSTSVPADTLFIFDPVAPLVDTLKSPSERRDIIGVDFLFSNSGYGLGGYYQRNFSTSLSGFVNVGFTGSRTKDELPVWNGEDYVVPNKVNRLYTIPMVIGLRYRLFEGELDDDFRPYVNAGVGPSMVLALPYEYEFFRSFGHARTYFTAGGFLGFGAEFGEKRPILGVNLRYFYIPLRPGVESLRDDPISDFGGLFLTLNIGFL
jgi:hypothetical protein